MVASTSAKTRGIPALILAQALIFLLPLGLASIPPLIDYPNHLTRYWLLAGGVGSAPVSSFYAENWNILTNIGLDLVASAVGPLVNVGLLGSVFIALAVILPFAGMALLNTAIFGRIDVWLLVPGLLVWNQTLLAGFLNFNVGVGLALLLAALDLRVAAAHPALAALLRFLGAIVLGLTHVFALAFFVALLVGLALGRDFGRREPILPIARRALVAVAPALLAFGLLLSMSGNVPGAHAAANATSLADDLLRGVRGAFSRDKAKGFLVAFISYYPLWELVALAIAGALLAAACWRRRLDLHRGLLLVAAGLFALACVAPMDLAGTGWFDRRFDLMFPMALVAAVHPTAAPRWTRPLAFGVFLLVALRTAEVGLVWRAYDRDVRSLQATLADVPEGARLLPVTQDSPRGSRRAGRYLGTGDPAFWHLPVLAIMWRHAFVPTLFTARGKQPLVVLPPYDKIAVPEGPLPNVHLLNEPTREHPEMTPYIDGWASKFEYVLVINADQRDEKGDFAPPPNLRPVRDDGFSRLYRIEKAAVNG